MTIKKFQAEDFEIASSKIEQISTRGESVEQILETGKFTKDGVNFQVDSDQMESFVRNFKDQVLGTDPPVNFGHERGGKASGWVKDLFLDPSKTKLFAVIKWTAAGLDALKGRTWRYLSAEFMNRFVDGSTGKQFGPTLAGVALTNVPFLRHMPAVVGLSNDDNLIELIQQNLEPKGDSAMDPNKDTISLADHNAAIKVLTASNEKMSKELDDLKTLAAEATTLKESNVKLNKDLSDMKTEIETQKRESEFEKLLSEGRACKAQRESFMANKMDEFIKLAQPINLGGVGHTGNQDPSDHVEKFDDLSKGEQKMFSDNLSATMSKEDYMKFRSITENRCAPVSAGEDV